MSDAAVANFRDGAASTFNGTAGGGESEEFALMCAGGAPAVDQEIASRAGDNSFHVEMQVGERGEVHGHGLASSFFTAHRRWEGIVLPYIGIVEEVAIGV